MGKLKQMITTRISILIGTAIAFIGIAIMILASDYNTFFNTKESRILTESPVVRGICNLTEKRIVYNSNLSLGCWTVYCTRIIQRWNQSYSPFHSFKYDGRLAVLCDVDISFTVKWVNPQDTFSNMPGCSDPSWKVCSNKDGIFHINSTVADTHKLYPHDRPWDYTRHWYWYHALAAMVDDHGMYASVANFSVEYARLRFTGNISFTAKGLYNLCCEPSLNVFMKELGIFKKTTTVTSPHKLNAYHYLPWDYIYIPHQCWYHELVAMVDIAHVGIDDSAALCISRHSRCYIPLKEPAFLKLQKFTLAARLDSRPADMLLDDHHVRHNRLAAHHLAAMMDDHVRWNDASVAKFSMDNAPQSLGGNLTSRYVWIDSNATENTVVVSVSEREFFSGPFAPEFYLLVSLSEGEIFSELLNSEQKVQSVALFDNPLYLPENENFHVPKSVSTNPSSKINLIIAWKFLGQTSWNRTSIHVPITVFLIISIISIVLWMLAIKTLCTVAFRVLRRIIKSLSTAIKTLCVVVFRVIRSIIKCLSIAIKTFCVVVLRVQKCMIKSISRPVQPGDMELVVNNNSHILEVVIYCKNPRAYKYNELTAATNNFSEDQKLGEGGFGSVYKGILHEDICETVAVKRISAVSRQGSKEYMSEITILDQLRHRSLVPLLGWCHEKARELLLVYKFMPNGSLDKYLFGSGADRPTLQWNTRYRIACDIASALLYLHDECEQRVLHRDVKPSNIMLDSDFQAKLGDFGLARVIDHCGSSHFTAPAGTHGYLAPEIAMSGTASTKSDVFSFGVVALEIACGRRALDRMGQLDESCCWPLVGWVWDLYGKRCMLDAADNRLDGEFDVKEMRQLMVVGLWCSNPDRKKRPKIRQVLQTLKFEAPLPNLPSKMPNIFELTPEEFTADQRYSQRSFPDSAPALLTVNSKANTQWGDLSAPAITM